MMLDTLLLYPRHHSHPPHCLFSYLDINISATITHITVKMKFLHAVLYAFVASQGAIAAPVVDMGTEVVEYRTANPENLALVALEQRAPRCQTLRSVIHGIGTSKIT